jgi:GNAT superfamily N-acetyltransferase
MATVEYHYPRALELEGRHPADVGCWPITIRRLEVGEGLPSVDSPWRFVHFAEGEPIPPTRRPPPGVLCQQSYYRRIRSSAECDRRLSQFARTSLHAAFQLTVAWANPPQGLIPLPSSADPPIPLTHAARILDRIPDKRLFHFRLKWRDWGDNGTGYMHYEWFDRYVFECWATYCRAEELRLFKLKKLDDNGRVRWSAQDEDDHRIYGFVVRDARLDECRAWTFVIERDGALEVEELYVRPEYRRLGHGHWLADRVTQLALEKRMPLRLWVAFADCKAESESNYPALVATARHLGVQFQPCLVPWAAYFGTNEKPGKAFPVEPATIPTRPRAPRKELLAFVLALSGGNGEHGLDVPVPAANRPQPAAVAKEDGTRVPIATFLEEVYELARVNDLESATDRIFDFTDRLLCDGYFSACDDILRTVDVDKLPTALMRSFLSITAAAKEKLPSRPALFLKIEQKMIERRGAEKARKILANLA